MATCINCKREIPDGAPIIWWGMDGDACCSQECYDAVQKDMDIECGVTRKKPEVASCCKPMNPGRGQCCCNCMYRLEDFSHAVTDGGSVKDLKGYICSPPIPPKKSFSGWSEHGMCEMWDLRPGEGLPEVYKLRRELSTVRHYMNKDNEAMVNEAMERGDFVEPDGFEAVTLYKDVRVMKTTENLQAVLENAPSGDMFLPTPSGGTLEMVNALRLVNHIKERICVRHGAMVENSLVISLEDWFRVIKEECGGLPVELIRVSPTEVKIKTKDETGVTMDITYDNPLDDTTPDHHTPGHRP